MAGDLFGAQVETTIGQPVQIRNATQCAFVPFTPVPREFAGEWVRLVVCEDPSEHQQEIDEGPPPWED